MDRPDYVSALFGASNPGLFFSQMNEPAGGYDKAIAVYNPTSSAIDLSAGYIVGKIANAGLVSVSWNHRQPLSFCFC